MLIKSYITSQLNYCSSIWVRHNKSLSNKINKAHKGALRTAYGNYKSSFQKLRQRDNYVAINQINLQYFAI